MSSDLLRTLLAAVEVLRPALTAPGFEKALVVFVGWVLTSGPHAVTSALVATDVASRRHHEGFHRFFSRGSWSTDDLGRLLFRQALRLLAPDKEIQVVLDDTLATKKGPHVFGIGSHLDAVRSTKSFRVFSFGHVWVVASIVVRVPFSRRPWALPILFRLYRNKSECRKNRGRYRKKTELGRELVDLLASWADGRRLHVSMDSAYCNDTLTRGLASNVTVFGAIRPDAVLTAEPNDRDRKSTGRKRIRGRSLPKPAKLAIDERRPWQKCKAFLYGRHRSVQYKTIEAQWYRGCGARLVRIIITKSDTGSIAFRVFLCTDTTLSVPVVLETYAGRWATEVTFRELKQLLGFVDSSARKRAAVERTAPFVGYIYTILVLWFANGAWKSQLATPPIRPWYRHKHGASFADILRTAQRTLASIDVLDLASSFSNLQKEPAPPSVPPPRSGTPGAQVTPDHSKLAA